MLEQQTLSPKSGAPPARSAERNRPQMDTIGTDGNRQRQVFLASGRTDPTATGVGSRGMTPITPSTHRKAS